MTLFETIAQAKRDQRAVVAAHTYQAPEVQDAADIVGDSFALAQKAQAADADAVYVCGVRFMAEGVKILAPEKRVVLVEPTAGCPMARQIAPARVRAFRQEHPEYAVVAYINTTAALKAEADVCVTSSSAVRIVRALPQRDILFIPDQHLGGFVRAQVPEKHIVTWDGYCPVHQGVTAAMIREARARWPGATVAIHPECPAEAVALADMVGSTAAIIDYIHERLRQPDAEVIVVTERGVVDRLAAQYSGRLHQLCPEVLVCPDMKRTTLAALAAAMKGRGGEEIVLPRDAMDAARTSLDAMLRLG